MAGRWMMLVLSLLFLWASSLGEGLPEDVPIRYPELEMDSSATDSDDPVSGETGEAISISPGINGLGGANTITIPTASNIYFPTPYSEGVVDFANPITSTVNVQYLLHISAAELLRQIGRSGYEDAAYRELQSEEGFDPENQFIVLAKTKGIPPGKRVHTVVMDVLPDGTYLPCGKYTATVTMVAYDMYTNQFCSVGFEAAVQLQVLSDETAITVTDGEGRIQLFAPESESKTVLYTLVTTEGELLNKTGASHAGVMVDGVFMEYAYKEYGIVTLCELGMAEPGQFLDGCFSLGTLPDGALLPAGEYTAWIARNVFDEELGLWSLIGADTRVALTVQ